MYANCVVYTRNWNNINYLCCLLLIIVKKWGTCPLVPTPLHTQLRASTVLQLGHLNMEIYVYMQCIPEGNNSVTLSFLCAWFLMASSLLRRLENWLVNDAGSFDLYVSYVFFRSALLQLSSRSRRMASTYPTENIRNYFNPYLYWLHEPAVKGTQSLFEQCYLAHFKLKICPYHGKYFMYAYHYVSVGVG